MPPKNVRQKLYPPRGFKSMCLPTYLPSDVAVSPVEALFSEETNKVSESTDCKDVITMTDNQCTKSSAMGVKSNAVPYKTKKVLATPREWANNSTKVLKVSVKPLSAKCASKPVNDFTSLLNFWELQKDKYGETRPTYEKKKEKIPVVKPHMSSNSSSTRMAQTKEVVSDAIAKKSATALIQGYATMINEMKKASLVVCSDDLERSKKDLTEVNSSVKQVIASQECVENKTTELARQEKVSPDSFQTSDDSFWMSGPKFSTEGPECETSWVQTPSLVRKKRNRSSNNKSMDEYSPEVLTPDASRNKVVKKKGLRRLLSLDPLECSHLFSPLLTSSRRTSLSESSRIVEKLDGTEPLSSENLEAGFVLRQSMTGTDINCFSPIKNESENNISHSKHFDNISCCANLVNVRCTDKVSEMKKEVAKVVKNFLDFSNDSQNKTSTQPSMSIQVSTSSEPSIVNQSPTTTKPSGASQSPTATQLSVASKSPTITKPGVASQSPAFTTPSVASHSPTTDKPGVVSQSPAFTIPSVASHSPTTAKPGVASHSPTTAKPDGASQIPTFTKPSIASESQSLIRSFKKESVVGVYEPLEQMKGKFNESATYELLAVPEWSEPYENLDRVVKVSENVDYTPAEEVIDLDAHMAGICIPSLKVLCLQKLDELDLFVKPLENSDSKDKFIPLHVDLPQENGTTDACFPPDLQCHETLSPEPLTSPVEACSTQSLTQDVETRADPIENFQNSDALSGCPLVDGCCTPVGRSCRMRKRPKCLDFTDECASSPKKTKTLENDDSFEVSLDLFPLLTENEQDSVALMDGILPDIVVNEDQTNSDTGNSVDIDINELLIYIDAKDDEISVKNEAVREMTSPSTNTDSSPESPCDETMPVYTQFPPLYSQQEPSPTQTNCDFLGNPQVAVLLDDSSQTWTEIRVGSMSHSPVPSPETWQYALHCYESAVTDTNEDEVRSELGHFYRDSHNSMYRTLINHPMATEFTVDNSVQSNPPDCRHENHYKGISTVGHCLYAQDQENQCSNLNEPQSSNSDYEMYRIANGRTETNVSSDEDIVSMIEEKVKERLLEQVIKKRENMNNEELCDQLKTVRPYVISGWLSTNYLMALVKKTDLVNDLFSKPLDNKGHVQDWIVKSCCKTTPEVLARDLVFRLFTLRELQVTDFTSLRRYKRYRAIKLAVQQTFKGKVSDTVWRSRCAPFIQTSIVALFSTRVRVVQNFFLLHSC